MASGYGSDGAPLSAGSMLSSSTNTSSSSRDSDMASKLEKTSSLTVRLLQEITDYFADERKIGQGAYGQVYRAKLENGEEIAVKMLYNTTPGIDDVQFQREFENLMRLEHHNIVKLVGYCYETQHQPMQYMGKTIFAERIHRALCFEYMENGSLEKHLSDECGGLDWHTRYRIIKGSWKGLRHLHEGSNEPLYHLDIKPDNILLDKNMTAKLADFGLSKLFSDKQTMITQSPMGTIGYLPMEYLHGQIVSNKFDIFSLGVVMIKIIAGHGGYSRSAEMPRQEFLDQVNENWRNRMLRTCGASQTLEAYCEQVYVCTSIALRCMEIDRHKRPEMADIIHQMNDTEDVIDKALSWTTIKHPMIDGDMVKLEALTMSEAVPSDEIRNEYPILVRVTAPPWEAEELARPGVDLVLVLDTINDEYRLVLKEVMTKLGLNDRIAIVSDRGRCALKLTFMSDKEGNIARLMEISNPDGRETNMIDSVREASEILKKREVGEGHSRVGFIIAMSLACLWDSAIMIRQNIKSQFPVHTLGLCPRDLNAKAMKYVADVTSGTYSFISKFHDEVIHALELLIGNITKVAATSIKITLTAHEGVAVSSIESGGYSSRVNSQGRSGEIDINDIFAGETKNLIVKLKFAKGKSKLVTIGGQYCSLSSSKQLLADTDVLVLRPRSACSLEKLAMHPEVAAELVRVRLVKGGISAIPELLDKYYYRTDKIKESIKEIWEKISLSEEGRRAPEETLAGLVKDVAEIEKEMMDKPTNEKQAYMLSWLSCHEWQRATTKGSRSHSGAFMV